MATSTLSPSFKQKAGSFSQSKSSGVPVKITVPGIKVLSLEERAISSGIVASKSSVENSDTILAPTLVVMIKLLESIAHAGVIDGPRGRQVAKDSQGEIASSAVAWAFLSTRWLAIVKPNMWLWAASSLTFRPFFPMMIASSPLQKAWLPPHLGR
eukprot:CAMPEP_0184497636 /NCGR_PEP_ID=MMETSP0113_2-20130426/37059_1 /TAXON_ID=91329 /ORGANISM="Norrisiella sphaerica, Strain BC52" /LENGTH=154 /DNA_ID=CAMNT_0026884833 /DNA_START=60 /DNA_END=524 /DNA_ORIENTATION=+